MKEDTTIPEKLLSPKGAIVFAERLSANRLRNLSVFIALV
jgi:hypothetical protein